MDTTFYLDTCGIEREYTYNEIDCPDCGRRTTSQCSRSYPYGSDIPEPGYYFTIDCQACGYYEFGYNGPDY